MQTDKRNRLFHIVCDTERKHLAVYAALSAVLSIVSLILGINWIISLAGGAALMLFLMFRLRVDDALPVPFRFLILVIFTVIIFMLMQTAISCGFILIGPVKFVMNIVLLLGLVSLLWMVTGNVKLTVTVVTVLCFIIGIADHLVVQARSFEIQFSDLSSIGTAVEVAGGYSFEISQTSRTAVILGICFITFVLRSHFPSHERSWHRTAISLGAITLTVLCAIMIYTQLWSSAIDYQDKYWKYRGSERNGFWVNIIYSASATRVTVPEGYDGEALPEHLEDYLADEKTEPSAAEKKKPNVIVIMNETFCDVHNVAKYLETGINFSESPTPFLDSLSDVEDNIMKGHALASVYGGNTANSELEFLTEMSVQFIPRNTVAYNLYMKQENIFSIVDLFNDAGYKTVGMHPENRTNWQRDRIYSYYGFDETYFADDFTDLTEEDYFRGHISDAAAYRKVEELYEQKDPDEPMFAFVVTMQNHGGYLGTGFTPEDYVINVEGYENYMSIREYLASIRNSDEALRELVEYFENADEETLILFYGDHQPSLSNIASKFYHVTDESSQRKQQAKYVVPYLFWANYPISCDRATPLTSINYLSSWLLDMVDVGGTDFTEFVKKTNEEIMAVNAMGWFDYGYSFHETDYVNQNYSDTLTLYSHLQYNAMFDKERKLVDVFGIRGEN
ncbi:MAG: LTA synthase family protein [Clostridia bacterium]|nr:LTA synthase family protein [Clostridia bacterium]